MASARVAHAPMLEKYIKYFVLSSILDAMTRNANVNRDCENLNTLNGVTFDSNSNA